MGDVQYKNRINSICIIAISFLYFTELVMNQFGLNNSVLVYTIRDASSFFTLISVSFLIYSIRQKPRPVWQIIGNSFNIVLINRLYSNHMWRSVFQYIIGLDKQLLIGSAVAVFFIGLFVFWVISERHKKGAAPQAENKQSASASENAKAETVVPNPAGQNSPAAQAPLSTPSVAPAHDNQPSSSNESDRHPIFTFITRFIVCFAIILYWIQYTDHGKQLLPDFIEPIIRYFYLFAIVSLAILIAIKIINWKKQNSTPEVSPLVPIIFTGFVLFKAYDGRIEDFSTYVLDAIANNLFASVIGVFVLYVINDLLAKTAYHLLSPNSSDEVTNIMKESLNKIEKNMVKIACRALESCVSLFGFIPDFFEDIGVILLGHHKD